MLWCCRPSWLSAQVQMLGCCCCSTAQSWKLWCCRPSWLSAQVQMLGCCCSTAQSWKLWCCRPSSLSAQVQMHGCCHCSTGCCCSDSTGCWLDLSGSSDCCCCCCDSLGCWPDLSRSSGCCRLLSLGCRCRSRPRPCLSLRCCRRHRRQRDSRFSPSGCPGAEPPRKHSYGRVLCPGHWSCPMPEPETCEQA